jgi:hypothetical protein
MVFYVLWFLGSLPRFVRGFDALVACQGAFFGTFYRNKQGFLGRICPLSVSQIILVFLKPFLLLFPFAQAKAMGASFPLF